MPMSTIQKEQEQTQKPAVTNQQQQQTVSASNTNFWTQPLSSNPTERTPTTQVPVSSPQAQGVTQIPQPEGTRVVAGSVHPETLATVHDPANPLAKTNQTQETPYGQQQPERVISYRLEDTQPKDLYAQREFAPKGINLFGPKTGVMVDGYFVEVDPRFAGASKEAQERELSLIRQGVAQESKIPTYQRQMSVTESNAIGGLTLATTVATGVVKPILGAVSGGAVVAAEGVKRGVTGKDLTIDEALSVASLTQMGAAPLIKKIQPSLQQRAQAPINRSYEASLKAGEVWQPTATERLVMKTTGVKPQAPAPNVIELPKIPTAPKETMITETKMVQKPLPNNLQRIVDAVPEKFGLEKPTVEIYDKPLSNGVGARIDLDTRTIELSAAETPSQQEISLSHEIGHYVFDQYSKTPQGRAIVEEMSPVKTVDKFVSKVATKIEDKVADSLWQSSGDKTPKEVQELAEIITLRKIDVLAEEKTAWDIAKQLPMSKKAIGDFGKSSKASLNSYTGETVKPSREEFVQNYTNPPARILSSQELKTYSIEKPTPENVKLTPKQVAGIEASDMLDAKSVLYGKSMEPSEYYATGKPVVKSGLPEFDASVTNTNDVFSVNIEQKSNLGFTGGKAAVTRPNENIERIGNFEKPKLFSLKQIPKEETLPTKILPNSKLDKTIAVVRKGSSDIENLDNLKIKKPYVENSQIVEELTKGNAAQPTGIEKVLTDMQTGRAANTARVVVQQPQPRVLVNPFTAQRGRPYYQQRQTEEYETQFNTMPGQVTRLTPETRTSQNQVASPLNKIALDPLEILKSDVGLTPRLAQEEVSLLKQQQTERTITTQQTPQTTEETITPTMPDFLSQQAFNPFNLGGKFEGGYVPSFFTPKVSGKSKGVRYYPVVDPEDVFGVLF